MRETERNNTPLLRLESVRRAFRLGTTEHPALDGVDLSVSGGEIVFVRGPSGAGKSTLLNQIALLDEPDEGRVLFDGDDTRAISDTARTALRGEKIGIIFQSFNLVPVLSALENVTLPLLLGKKVPRDATRRAADLLDAVGMRAFSHKRVTLLSGGQRQRVAIARALVQNPKLIVADEPTANLDSENGARVLDLLLHLNLEHNATLVIATHDDAVRAAASREIVMKDGRIISDRATRALAAE